MKELIERLRKATGPDRELDKAIAFEARWHPQNFASKASFAEHEAKHDYATAWIAHSPWHSSWDIPHYTASIDAALTLVPDEWTAWELKSRGNKKRFTAELSRLNSDHTEKYVWGNAPSPAIALCIAALEARAIAATDRTPPTGSAPKDSGGQR